MSSIIFKSVRKFWKGGLKFPVSLQHFWDFKDAIIKNSIHYSTLFSFLTRIRKYKSQQQVIQHRLDDQVQKLDGLEQDLNERRQKLFQHFQIIKSE
jgi:hypothetical protein